MSVENSWLIRAIEQAALIRARRELEKEIASYTHVYGVPLRKVRWLMLDYESRTGRKITETDDGN